MRILPCLIALQLAPLAIAQPSYGLAGIDVSGAPDGVVPLPETVHRTFRRVFDRYTRVLAPNGKAIHIVAQSGWRREQIIRARKVLEHMLTDAPGTAYGADKSKVANVMADRHATLVLFDTERALERALRGPMRWVRLPFQDLRANECPVEGTNDYMKHRTRDAAFEEILHFVHDHGIRRVLKAYDREMQEASDALERRGLWDPFPEDEPDSHRNEYIAAVYDNYLDLWTVPPTVYEGERIPRGEIPRGTSHFGVFRGGASRDALKKTDPTGYALIEKFFPPHLTYTPDLPASFEGTFSITFDSKLPYTRKAQHLRSVRLTGERDANLTGNAYDNVLTGNRGDNVIDGRGGRDTAVFTGKKSEYRIKTTESRTTVTDLTQGRDGTDTLIGIEVMRFADGDVKR